MLTRPTRPALYRWLLCLSLAVSLSGCGWHLAGQQYKNQGQEWVSSLNYIRLDKNREFNVVFEETMAHRGITDSPQARLRLVIAGERFKRKAYAYSSTGNPVQYQLEMFVDFYFEHTPKEGEALETKSELPKLETIVARRQFDFQADAVIAKKQEEKALKLEMYHDIAERILAKAVIDSLPEEQPKSP